MKAHYATFEYQDLPYHSRAQQPAGLEMAPQADQPVRGAV